MMMGSAIATIAIVTMSVCAGDKPFKQDFAIDKSDLASKGENPYFVLRPSYQLRFGSAGGELVVTVLHQTKNLMGVETRVVEEREYENGRLVEVSRNYFAISKKTKDVYYFGEDVDIYDASGKITGHGGSWHAGERGAKPGLMVPAKPKVAGRYYEEVAPKVAMDRAEVVSVSERLHVPAGSFHNVVKTEETTPLEPGNKEHKWYARGVGLIKDADMQLVAYGYVRYKGVRRTH